MYSTHYDYIILGATCLLPSQTSPNSLIELVTDIGIQNGRIKYIGSLANSSCDAKYLAKGLHLLPGLIDSQVHFREPGNTHKENLETGTRSAILGGITSVFEMPNTNPPTTTVDRFNDKVALTKNRIWCNVGFYIGAENENKNNLPKLESLPGCCGVKIFMGSSTGSLLIEDEETLEVILKNGKRRVAIHAEDEFRLRERKQIALTMKNVNAHPLWRDESTALIATQRLIRLAELTKRPVHVLHISTAEEMEFLANKKHIASVECLPQYLTFSAPECYERLGSLVQMNPPIRNQKHQDALWKALNNNIIDVLGSDHAPHTLDEKKLPYPQSPSGMPGVQTLLPIMLNHVNNGRLSIEKLVSLLCSNPAKLFKLKDRGSISLNNYADFTLIDLKAERRIENRWIASQCGWTPYDGLIVKGWPKATFINGKMAMCDDEVINSPSGKLLEFN